MSKSNRPPWMRHKLAAMAKENRQWREKAGPVTVRKIGDPPPPEDPPAF